MAQSSIGLNMTLPIYNEDGTLFHSLELKKFAVDSIVMSLADKITGDVYFENNELDVTMREYVEYNGVKYTMVNPPTIVREGMVSNNSELKGLTKYSFEFYHPMYQLANFPFSDVATSSDENRYLSDSKVFSWIGLPSDYVTKLNKNLQGTEWVVVMSSRFPEDKKLTMSEVLSFSDNTVADALKVGYETWGVPYVVDMVKEDTELYNSGKRFLVQFGLPVEEILDYDELPFVFKCGKDVGLKNNSRTPRNNKIVTRIAGYGSENNIPYGYPQIVWDGADDDPRLRYTLYDGIVGGRNVKLINHPFTRKTLMPSVYSESVNRKVNPNAQGYDPDIELVDYYDATEGYPNMINPLAPSYISHGFDVKPEMDDGQSNVEILDAYPINDDLTVAESWNDTIDADGNYQQSYFKMKLPMLTFDLYACAAITEEMKINMRSGACLGCTFTVQVDWENYKLSFYDSEGNFAPNGSQRDMIKYPKSDSAPIEVILKKENETFGTVMPNQYQYPREGDKFVVLGISLPLEYIENAEKRLDDEMKAYMLENNVYYFDYPLKFSEHFLATRTDILSQLKPNVVVRFDFAGQEMQLFVKQLTVKYGSSVLPQYDVLLTDNVDVVLNQIGQVVSDVEHLSSLVTLLRDYYNKGVFGELSTKLSRISDDTAQGVIGFLRGIWFGTKKWFIDRNGNANLNDTTVNGMLTAYDATMNNVRSSNYSGDGIADTGWKITNDYGNGDSYAVFDRLYIRKKATFEELEIRRLTHVGGNLVLSPAKGRICRVDYYDASGGLLGYEEMLVPWNLFGRIFTLFKPHNALNRYLGKKKLVQKPMTQEQREELLRTAKTVRCYMFTDDGTTDTTGGWTVDALARCQTFNVNTQMEYDGSSWTGTKVGNTYWWRRVRAVGNAVLSDGNKHDWVEFHIRRQDMSEDCDLGDHGEECDIPSVGDVMAQFGHWTRPELSAVVTLETYNGDIRGFREYDQIMNFNLNNKNWVSIGYDASTGRAMSRIYGDFYYGAMDNSTYVRYNALQRLLEIKAVISVQSPLSDGQTVSDLIDQVVDTDTELTNLMDSGIISYGTEKQELLARWKNTVDEYENLVDQIEDYYGSSAEQFITPLRYAFTNVATMLNNGVTPSASILDGTTMPSWINSTNISNNTVLADTPTLNRATYDTTWRSYTDQVYWAQTGIAAQAKIFANNAQYSADLALGKLSDMANDGKLDPSEKQDVKRDFEAYYHEMMDSTGILDKAKDSNNQWIIDYNTWIKPYQDAFADIGKYLNGDVAWTIPELANFTDANMPAWIKNANMSTTNDIVSSTWRSKWSTFYTKRSAVLTTLTSHAESAANGAQATANSAATAAQLAQQKAASMEYLKTALAQDTDIQGGLILSTIIALRDSNDRIWSGMNGVYVDANSIAAWYGGEAYDIVRHPEYKSPSYRYAKGLVRMDGTGYFAGGNILWEADGSGSVAGGNIAWDASGNIVIKGNTVNPSVQLEATKVDTTNYYLNGVDITNTLNALLSMFTREGSGTSADPYVIKANYGLYTNQFLTALGQDDGGGGGGSSILFSTLGDVDVRSIQVGQYIKWNGTKFVPGDGGGGGGVDMTAVWNALAQSTTEQINTSHLSDALNAYAYIQNGVIHIGSQSVTPATSVAWADVTGKPETFPPSTHTHSQYITADGSCNYANSSGSAGIANKVYMTSHIGSWWMSSDWDGTYFWITGKYDTSQLPCAVAYATNANYANSCSYANSAGSATDSTKLPLAGGDMNQGARISGSGGDLYLGNSNNAGWMMCQDMCSQDSRGDGLWSIRTNGNANFRNIISAGLVDALSDIRKKDVKEDFVLDINEISLARLIKFTWKDKHDEDVHSGGIAQEWQKILPEAVYESADGTLYMDYGVIGMVSAVSLARKVVEQDEEISALKMRLEKIEMALGILQQKV